VVEKVGIDICRTRSRLIVSFSNAEALRYAQWGVRLHDARDAASRIGRTECAGVTLIEINR
jgi:hypothetical protein